MTATGRRLVSSIELANTILREHSRARRRPTIVELCGQVHAADTAYQAAYGTTITGDTYTDRSDGLGMTTGTLRSKFAGRSSGEKVTAYIPAANGDTLLVADRDVRRIVRDVIRATVRPRYVVVRHALARA